MNAAELAANDLHHVLKAVVDAAIEAGVSHTRIEAIASVDLHSGQRSAYRVALLRDYLAKAEATGPFERGVW